MPFVLIFANWTCARDWTPQQLSPQLALVSQLLYTVPLIQRQWTWSMQMSSSSHFQVETDFGHFLNPFIWSKSNERNNNKERSNELPTKSPRKGLSCKLSLRKWLLLGSFLNHDNSFKRSSKCLIDCYSTHQTMPNKENQPTNWTWPQTNEDSLPPI